MTRLDREASAAKSLFLGTVLEENIYPYPELKAEERETLAMMLDSIEHAQDDFLARERIDQRNKAEAKQTTLSFGAGTVDAVAALTWELPASADTAGPTGAPVKQLAALYVMIGNSEGVRGDLAFAQSCVETGVCPVRSPMYVDPLSTCPSAPDVFGPANVSW